MVHVSPYCLGAIVIAVLSGYIVDGSSATTGLSPAENDQRVSVFVDRTKKADRLSALSRAKIYLDNSSSTAMVSSPSKRPPLGCDPVFSSIANPATARIYKRCAA